MSKKITVVGAGHGGLVAASRLAESGFDVTVIEKKKEEDLGHDWEDRFTFELLEKETGCVLDKNPGAVWRYRGDCAFVSPSHRTSAVVRYTDENRQKVMWRKPLIAQLVKKAKDSSVRFLFETAVSAPIETDGKVSGVITSTGEKMYSDLVIDAAGCMSSVRSKLSSKCAIEQGIKRGDVFYAWRAYFNKTDAPFSGEAPFEVYLYHECEQGLSWCCTNDDSVDILIGRIDPLNNDKVKEQLEIFRSNHPWVGNEILHGGNFGIIPVRRPLDVMVCDGYAAVGDSAFMTTPMNGMGIDLSIKAGALLADTVISGGGNFTKEALWNYNRDYLRLYGGKTAKNEGLKNSILQLPPEGVDFLFESKVIQSSDLAGAGQSTSLSALLGKFFRGMKKPRYFLAIIGGLIKGSALCKAYESVLEQYNITEIQKWRERLNKNTIAVTRRL